jgi:hypothetical protein
LGIEGFHCIQSFFVLINQINGNLFKIGEWYGVYNSSAKPLSKGSGSPFDQEPENEPSKKKPSYTSIGSDGVAKQQQFSFTQEGHKSSTADAGVQGPILGPVQGPANKPAAASTTQADVKAEDPEDLTIKVVVKPIVLQGYDLIWRIATESTGKQVIDAAARILIQMHYNVSFELKPQISEFDQMFIDKCFSIIQKQVPFIEKRSPEETRAINETIKALPAHASTIQTLKALPLHERKIVRAIFLIRQVVRHTEKFGTHALKPHASLKAGVYLPTIQVSNNITGDKEGFAKRLELGIDSHATLWDLKKLIGEQIIKPGKGENTADTRLEATFPSAPVHPATIRVF